MKTLFSMFALTLTVCSTGNCVSRVGGGRVSSESSQFSMEFSKVFRLAGQNTNVVRAIGPMAFVPTEQGAIPISQYFEVSEFANEFPDAVNSTKDELLNRFRKSQWTAITMNPDCALLIKSTSDGALAYIMIWSSQKGFMIKGTNTFQTDQVIKNALQTLTIESKGCEWK